MRFEKDEAALVVVTGRHHEVETYQMMIRRLMAEGVVKRHFMLFFDTMRREEWKKSTALLRSSLSVLARFG